MCQNCKFRAKRRIGDHAGKIKEAKVNVWFDAKNRVVAGYGVDVRADTGGGLEWFHLATGSKAFLADSCYDAAAKCLAVLDR